ncbi:cyclic lactone autoinducer peptide [Sedimentibacter sp. MB31-C6]|nr:cyclic lactone autoinducer peptide [Sedimentibacter sp. MB36-C1]WSI04152.1 cyclic lactone autoinducer peptide [Sedimentibacter sp. MB36-C1]
MKNIKTIIGKTLTNVMLKTAVNNANTTSCCIMHQPKVPTELKNLRRNK